MTIFDNAIKAGYQTVQSVAGKTVSYRSISLNETVSLTAIVGKSTFEIDTDFGLITKQVRDFIIYAPDLVLGSATYEPVVGDRITEIIGDTEYIWETYNPTQSPVFYYTDTSHQYMRIHTQMVDAN
jgi:hypothetical protein